MKNLALIFLTMILTSCGVQEYELIRGSTPTILWGNGEIPYIIDPAFPPKVKESIQKAINTWNESTVIHFVERDGEFNYVNIKRVDKGCASTVGFMGDGEQEIVVEDTCGYAAVLHELGHTIGLIHEQQRFDRDDYVEIVWDNILDGQEGNFEKTSKLDFPVVGQYDYNSIMQYDSYAFSKTGEPTILKKDGSEPDSLVYVRELSPMDIEKVNTLYAK